MGGARLEGDEVGKTGAGGAHTGRWMEVESVGIALVALVRAAIPLSDNMASAKDELETGQLRRTFTDIP